MEQQRGLLIFTTLVSIGAALWVSGWIAVNGTAHVVPWWWFAAGFVAVGAVCHYSEQAITRRLERTKIRRAHVRPSGPRQGRVHDLQTTSSPQPRGEA